MEGRLNILQQAMVQWNELHAYNAVHVARVPEPLERNLLESLIRTTLQDKGLTGLVLDRSSGRFHYHGGPDSSEISVMPVGLDWSDGFIAEIERQLNTPFPSDQRLDPFRFLIFPETEAFSLALVYFHPVADAECILILLKDIVEAYRVRGDRRRSEPLKRYTPRWDSPLRLKPNIIAGKLASIPTQVRSMRRASRPRYRQSYNLENRFVLFSLTPERWLHSAKGLGVTLNDLFLAVLMRAISDIAPARLEAKRRKDVALGCIVNIRKDLALDGSQVFGLFLGSFVVQHNVPQGIKLADLARDIGEQTHRIKRKRLYIGAVLELVFARCMMRLFSKARRLKLYHKHYPLWGGLSNMDLNRLWPQTGGAPPVLYLRGVSTGPVTPLVLSFSTLGGVTQVGLSYRPVVFSETQVRHIRDCFVNPESVLGETL
jgi:hypothetical protein